MGGKTWIESNGLSANRRQETGQRGALRLFLGAVTESVRRSRQRRDLAHLSEHSLRDIGLSRAEVEFELRKPMWRR